MGLFRSFCPLEFQLLVLGLTSNIISMVMRKPQQEALKSKRKALDSFVLLCYFFPLNLHFKAKTALKKSKARAKFLQLSSAHNSGFFRWLSQGHVSQCLITIKVFFCFLAKICIYLFY